MNYRALDGFPSIQHFPLAALFFHQIDAIIFNIDNILSIKQSDGFFEGFFTHTQSLFDLSRITLVMQIQIPMRFLEAIQDSIRTTDRKSTRLNSSHVSTSYAVF